MAEEDIVQYKDISELKKELEGVKGKKDISTKELYDAVQRLSHTMTDMLEIFGAAAEQMKLEEKEYESSAKKHEMIISKLDKLIDQNKTIAEGMVAVVELVKEKFDAPSKEESLFKTKEEEPLPKPKPGPMPFIKPPQPEWRPRPEPMMPRMQPPITPPQMAPPFITIPPSPDFGQMPPMQPAPLPDLDFPEEPFSLEEEPKKKGLFGMFKK